MKARSLRAIEHYQMVEARQSPQNIDREITLLSVEIASGLKALAKTAI